MRKEKQFHFIYKTTNNLSGKYYIGMHSTDNLEDGYIGSGKRLRYSINKYGEENHTREILEFCKTRKELKSREEEIVNLNEIAKQDCINLVVGGIGFNGIYSIEACIKGGKTAGDIYSKRLKTDEIFKHKDSLIKSIRLKKLHKSGKVKPFDWSGRKHTEEAKKKMRKSKNVGIDNPAYGTRWITNEEVNKKIYKGDEIPTGFRLGRIKQQL